MKVSKDLQTRLLRHPRITILPFACNVSREPFVHLTDDVPVAFITDAGHWKAIESYLGSMKRNWAVFTVPEIISSYCLRASNETNFKVLTHPAVIEQVLPLLPFIVEQALLLPRLLQRPIPILKKGDSKTIFLTRQVCLSLIANAFLCTFPAHHLKEMPDFNFFRLFNDANLERSSSKREKLMCVINYFHIMGTQARNGSFLNQIISFERRYVAKRVSWDTCKYPLCRATVEPTKKIEEANNMLQVDFADRMVGGGVLNDGCLMEEIRFITCTELLVARLFTQSLSKDEVLVVTGAEKYSQYDGYSNDFRFKGPIKNDWGLQPVDNLGRTYLQTVAMNATRYKP